MPDVRPERIVRGVGPTPARGMIVGEAPGRRETKIGVPFVGRSGELLDWLLEDLHIDRRTVFVTNAVKVMPTDAVGRIRTPTEAEINKWHSSLMADVSATQPRAILALGRTAQYALTHRRDLEWGKPKEVPWGHPLAIVPAWHPAYVLRNGATSGMGWWAWVTQARAWAELVEGLADGMPVGDGTL